MELTYTPEAEAFRSEIRGWLEEHLPAGLVRAGLRDDARGATGVQRGVAPPPLRGRLDLRQLAGRVRRQGAHHAWRTSCWPRSSPGRRRRCGPTSSATRWSAPRSSSGGPRSRRRSSCPRSCAARCGGARASASRTRGSDLASLKTSAVLDGDEWVINGQKVWTTQAQYADYIFLLARTDPDGDEAPGHLVPAGADAAGRHRGAADHAARRHGRVQRGLLRQRPLPEGQRRRRGQQRLGRGQHDAGPRAGHVGDDQLPALRGGARPDGRRRPARNGRHRRPARPPAPGRATTRRSRSCASTACGRSRATLDGTQGPGDRRPRRDQQDVLVRDAPRRDGAGPRHLRRRRACSSTVGPGVGARGPATSATRARASTRSARWSRPSSSPGRRRSGAARPRSSATSSASGCSACPGNRSRLSLRRPPPLRFGWLLLASLGNALQSSLRCARQCTGRPHRTRARVEHRRPGGRVHTAVIECEHA